ncbi:hypothetical protein TNCV_1656501 [Trichonephila clavipes]|nr:hypothetical protein TNCV_1656501 [Trichonephila clavipes]
MGFEGHTEWHAGSSLPPLTNHREDRHIYLHVGCDGVSRSVNSQHGDLYFGFHWQSSKDRYGDSGVPNDKAGYRISTMWSLQISPGSACILMAVYF